MTKSIKIVSYEEAEKILECSASEITHIISINDPGTNPPSTLRNHSGNHLILNFCDTNKNYKESAPKLEHIKQIIDFSGTFNDESQILVHCHAGISRSSAAALAIIASNESNANNAIFNLLNIKRMIFPNALMVGLIDESLRFNGDLLKTYKETFERLYGIEVSKQRYAL
jgi:predicted protein tyrosine phosphatase